MYILGDIGNTETKLCLVSKNKKILKKITFSSKNINNSRLSYLFKKKISGILQETISVSDKIFLITGIGININKNPNIKNYPTINMSELTGKTVSKVKIENNLKQLFEKNFSRIYN